MQTIEAVNYYQGQWQKSGKERWQEVQNPATAETIGQVHFSLPEDVDAAVASARSAFPEWRRVPPPDRIQYLFKLKNLLEEHFDEIASTITEECGKTIEESRGELRRGIENVEVATGIPSLMMGYNLEDIAAGIDEIMIRQPIGVVAAITPFNFPAMIPLWFLPYAIACGNTFILKPSEKVPLTGQKIFQLIDKLDLPPGVINLINGDKTAVDALLDHPDVRAISFVGSSPVARYVYGRATAQGKRAQCQGGAKNPVVILPDADMELTTRIVSDSAFGCAGQRCLASSVAVPVGEAESFFCDSIVDAARSRKVGYGLDEGTEMGPVISRQSQERIQGLIDQGSSEGASLLVDGRGARISGYEEGFFIGPTILHSVPAESNLAQTEVFGPVLSLMPAGDLDEAIRLINDSSYGNMACLFTSSGAAARKFRYEVNAGNIGINVGVAAPMAFFPFSGMKESFFGDLHGQGKDAVEFYTEKKVVVERWPKEWSRKF